MRKLVVTENITLDGVIESLDDWFAATEGGDDYAAVNREHMAAADAVLLGRVTYEQFRGYWPLQTDDTTGITAYLDRTPKYVVSSTLEATDWRNTTILRGPLAEDVGALKRQPGKDIVVTGSVTLAQALVREGLVDEYRLLVYPCVLGRGRRLFPDGIDTTLRLADASTTTLNSSPRRSHFRSLDHVAINFIIIFKWVLFDIGLTQLSGEADVG